MERTWTKWKEIYRAADLKATVKKKARDAQFGSAAPQLKNEVMSQGEDTGDTKKPVTMDELEGCFDSLANAAVTGKDTLESLVNSNTVLTKTNAELSNTIKAQAAEIKSLAASLASIKTNKKGNGGGGGSKPKKEAKWCPHCKRDTWHGAENCFELAQNATKRRPGWKSVFDTNLRKGGKSGR